MLKSINIKALKKNGKVDKKGLGKALVAFLLVLGIGTTLTACSDKKEDVGTDPSQTQEQGQEEETTTLSVEDQIAELNKQIEDIKAALEQNNYAKDDTFVKADWDKFVAAAKTAVAGKINNKDDMGFITALTLLNIDYLDQNGKQILLDQYAHGQDIERILNDGYSLLSQIREWNTELTSTDNYFSFNNLIIDENDKAILAVLDGYVKEIYELNQNLTKENKAKIQTIFNTVLAFANGTGKIDAVIAGKTVQVSKVDLTRGGLFGAENTAQTISVMSRHAVAEADREKLDGALRSKDNLAKTQEVLVRYVTLGTYLGNAVDAEAQAKVVAAYEAGLAIVTPELAVMGVTTEEAASLYTIARIDYFMNGINSQYAFNAIYKDGLDINALFNQAEEAVRKIQEYNDKQTSVTAIYDLGRIFGNEVDLVSLRAISRTAYAVTSRDEATRENAVNTMKGYNQFSSDVFVHYTTKDAEGKEVDVKLDKNALSKGAHQIANWYTYYSVQSHKEAYGQYADSITALVDGTAKGLDPYEAIVLMVTEYCAENNIVAFDYEVGSQR